MANTPSADDLRAAFTFLRFDPIVGKPSYETLFKLETQETCNVATVVIRLPPPNKNLSVIVEQTAVYILQVGAPFPRLPYPGNAENLPVGSTLVKRQNIQTAYDANIKLPKLPNNREYYKIATRECN